MSAAYPVVVQRSLLGSIVKGALAALAGGVLIGIALMIALPNSGAPFFLGGVVLSAPIIALSGAIGGVVIHYLRGPTMTTGPARVVAESADSPPMSLRVAGGLAGFQCSGLIGLPESVSPAVTLSLTPLWIMAGVAVAWRIHRSSGSARALGMAVIYGATAHFAAAMVIWGAIMLVGVESMSVFWIAKYLAIAVAVVVGVTVYGRTKRAELA